MTFTATALMPHPLGDNNPPEPTPFEAISEEIEGLYEEAEHWLGGDGAESQAEADAISQLLDMARDAAKRADAARKEEKRPHDEAAAEVQRRYKPLAEKVERIAEVCKAVLTPWLRRVEAEKRAAAQAARAEAEAKALAAQRAMQASRDAGLAERERAEALVVEAKRAETAATRAEKDRAQAKGGARAVTLRTTFKAELVDPTGFARWVWINDKEELVTFLASIAQRYVDAKMRGLPGVDVREQKTAI